MVDNTLALGVRASRSPDYGAIVNQRINAMAGLASLQDEQAKQAQVEQLAQEHNTLAQMVGRGFNPDDPGSVNALIRAAPNLAPGFIKSVADSRSAASGATKAQIEVGQATDTRVKSALEMSRQLLDNIDPTSPDAPAQFLAWHQGNHTDPVLGPYLAAHGVNPEQSKATIDAAVAQGPEAVRNLILQSREGLDKFTEQNAPKLTSQNLGGTERVLATPGLGGRATVVPGSEVTRTAAPVAPRIVNTSRGIMQVDGAGNATPVKMDGAPLQPYRAASAGVGGPGGAPVPTVPATVSGEGALAGLTKAQADTVRALAEGRMALPTGAALRSPYWQQLIAATSQYDPTFDAANAPARVATRREFTSGKAATSINALNTVMGHLDALDNAITNLHNSSLPVVGQGINAALNATAGMNNSRKTALQSFNTNKLAVANEMAKVFVGGVGAEADRAHWAARLDAADTPETLRSVERDFAHLLKSRLNSLTEQYNTGMRTVGHPLPSDLNLRPENEAILQRLSGGGSPAAPQGYSGKSRIISVQGQ